MKLVQMVIGIVGAIAIVGEVYAGLIIDHVCCEAMRKARDLKEFDDWSNNNL